MKWLRRLLIGLGVLALLFALVIGVLWRSDLPLATLKAHWADPSTGSRFIAVDGMDIHYRDEGPRDGKLVVLLHGTGASLHTWDAWTADLTAHGYRVVRLDLPAFGLTGPEPHGDYRLETYVAVLEHFVAALALPSFALAGNSLGGTIAWRYALAYPARVTSLILVDAAGFPRTGPVPIAFRLGQYPLLAQLMAHLDPRLLVERTVRLTYGDPSRVTQATLDRYWEMTLRPGNRAAFGARTAVPFDDRTSELSSINVPTLIEWGARDRVIPVADAQRFANAIAGAELKTYDALGHIPMEEDGAQTVADARAFLRKLSK